MESKLFNLTTPLKIIVSITIITWCIIALFPLLWIVVMSIKLPVDSFASNPLKVIIGPSTKEQVGGLSFVNFIFLFLSIYLFYKLYQIRKILFDLINPILKFSLITFFSTGTPWQLIYFEAAISAFEALLRTAVLIFSAADFMRVIQFNVLLLLIIL